MFNRGLSNEGLSNNRLPKKDFLALVLFYTGIIWLATKLRCWLKDELLILAYHRILPEWDEHDYPGDLDLISASNANFDWQMGYLKRHFKVSHFHDTFPDTNTTDFRGRVIVTFDDGFVDNHDHMLPIAQKHQIPATVFISTDYMGSPKTFWFERLAEQIQYLSGKTLRLDTINFEQPVGQSKNEVRDVITLLQTILKQVPNAQRLAALAELETLTDPAPLVTDTISRPMTWEEVKHLHNNNIFIGSHAASHPILSRCSDQELRREIIDSKKTIEQQLSAPCDIIAFPVGGADAYDKRVISLIQEAQYTAGCSYEMGANNANHFPRWHLRRIHVERYTQKYRFAAALTFPNFF